MSLYVLLDLLVLAAPLALSFDRRVRYVRRWPAVLAASLLVALPYLAWDAWMASRGDWGFNPRYAGAFRLLHLPPGEYLFFLTVGFSCLFIYEVVQAYLRDRPLRLPRWGWLLPAAAAVAAALMFRRQNYTFTVLLAVAVFFLLATLVLPALLTSRNFWLAILITYVPFLIVNGVLTALPVVTYGARAIWGLRVYTIPLEDFFYSFSMLGFMMLAYRGFRRG
jgi:lycopene cyclase domain-containing protein